MWLARTLFAIAVFSVAAKPANTEDFGKFYQAYAIVTGTDMRQRPWGFAQCLREVLVKVSGDPRLKDDPRAVEAAAHADQFVKSFDYIDMMAGIPRKDDQGSYDWPYRLTVYFDPAGINGLLAKWGEKPWRGARPVVVPMLLVRARKPPAYLLSAETPAGKEQRGSLIEAASEFGVTVRLPSEAELAGWGVAVDRFPYAKAPPPSRAPGEAIVVGTLEWSETTPGWIGSWRTRWHGADRAWGITGVNYDAAFRDIVRGVVLLASGRDLAKK